MIDGARLQALIHERNTSQSELARRVGISQSAINRLTSGENYGSKHLHRIARELNTTPAYLEGEIDDPAADALPAPVPTLHHIMMPVALPSENALARMFEGLLEVADRTASTVELARELAQLLPSGLLQLRGRLTELTPMVPPRRKEVAEALASEDREPPR